MVMLDFLTELIKDFLIVVFERQSNSNSSLGNFEDFHSFTHI